MNSINIIGRMTAEPELRRTGDGTAVCSFSLAVKRPRVKDTTDFIECVVWRQSAEYLAKYGHRGDIVAVSGSLQSRKWEDKNQNKRTTWEVVAESVELLSSKRNSEGTGNPTTKPNSYQGSYGDAAQQNYQEINDPDVQLPF